MAGSALWSKLETESAGLSRKVSRRRAAFRVEPDPREALARDRHLIDADRRIDDGASIEIGDLRVPGELAEHDGGRLDLGRLRDERHVLAPALGIKPDICFGAAGEPGEEERRQVVEIARHEHDMAARKTASIDAEVARKRGSADAKRKPIDLPGPIGQARRVQLAARLLTVDDPVELGPCIERVAKIADIRDDAEARYRPAEPGGVQERRVHMEIGMREASRDIGDPRTATRRLRFRFATLVGPACGAHPRRERASI